MTNLHNIPMAVADVVFHLHSPLSVAELGIERRWGAFLGMPDHPSARVSLCWEESKGAPSPRGDLIYDPGSVWRMYRDGADYYAAIHYTGDTKAVLRANAGWDDLTLVEHRTSAQWESQLGLGAGELILRTAFVLAGGLLLHASGVDDNGQGIVFVGHSGEGKSTQAKLWNNLPGSLLINEDRIAARAEESGAMVYGTPWGGAGAVTRNHRSSLSALILLEQAQDNQIRLLPTSSSAPLLLARTLLPYWDRYLVQRATANLDVLLASVPVYHLRCRPEPDVVSLVRSVL